MTCKACFYYEQCIKDYGISPDRKRLCKDYKPTRLTSLLVTAEKRKSQDLKVFELKVIWNHLSKAKRKHLKMLFVESKWFYNNIVASGDPFSFDTKIQEVTVLNKSKELETRNLEHISSQMKQDLVHRTWIAIKSLATKKKQGLMVGRLRFKSSVNAVPLRQYGTTYWIQGNSIRVQGLKKPLRVKGLDQIPQDAEFANAYLLRKPSGYYFKVTCFVLKEQRLKTGKTIGLDFGIRNSITTSEGTKYHFEFPEPKRLKTISRKLNRATKGSHNRYKLKLDLSKVYERLSNRKHDTANKFVSGLAKDFDLIAIQDENIKGWHSGLFGRKVQHSILGRIKWGLLKQPQTIEIDRYFPSTKLCPLCDTLNVIGLSETVYACQCRYSEDRDTHAARNILREAQKLYTECIKSMPAEELTSGVTWSPGNRKPAPVTQEACML